MLKKRGKKRFKKRKRRARSPEVTVESINAVKIISLLALRNNGYGTKRLKEFSKDFNVILQDTGHGLLSLTDILNTIEEETGLSIEDLQET